MWRADTAKKSKKKFENEIMVAAEFLPKPDDPNPTVIVPNNETWSVTNPSISASGFEITSKTNTVSKNSSQTTTASNISKMNDLDNSPQIIATPSAVASCDQASNTGSNDAVIQCAKAVDSEFPTELLSNAEFHKQIYKTTHGHSLGEAMLKQNSSSPMSIDELISFFTGANPTVAANLLALSRNIAMLPEPASFMNKNVFNNNPYRHYAQYVQIPEPVSYGAKSTVMHSKALTQSPSISEQHSDNCDKKQLINGYLLGQNDNIFQCVTTRYKSYVKSIGENWSLPYNK